MQQAVIKLVQAVAIAAIAYAFHMETGHIGGALLVGIFVVWLATNLFSDPLVRLPASKVTERIVLAIQCAIIFGPAVLIAFSEGLAGAAGWAAGATFMVWMFTAIITGIIGWWQQKRAVAATSAAPIAPRQDGAFLRRSLDSSP